MNRSIAYSPFEPHHTSWTPQLAVEATPMVCIPSGAAVAGIFIHFAASHDFEYTQKFLATFISIPAKLVAFLLLGRLPLRYFGYLSHFPLASIFGIGGFGGLGLSIIYLLQRQFCTNASSAFDALEEHDHRRKEIKLDWALQEELLVQFICELYHTVAGVVMGVLAMRFFCLCCIDHRHLDLLMVAGLLGPTVSCSLVIFFALIGFAIIWCSTKCNSYLHRRTTLC